MRVDAQGQPLLDKGMTPEWGSIQDVVDAPLIDVPPDASWLSVAGMWLTLLLNLIQGVIAGLCKGVFVCISIGTCCIPCSEQLCSAMGSVFAGRPLYMAWTWWRYTFAGLTALIANNQSRLALFRWEWEAFGSDKYWWHGEGVWMWSYAMCDDVLRSKQTRHSAFGCIRACIPDLFATNILIFLSNDGPDSQWAAIRNAIHMMFLDTGLQAYRQRVAALPDMLAQDWKEPSIAELSDLGKLQRMVSKCIMYVMFGKWISHADAGKLTGWRSSALFFILPRLVQRFLFNYGINKVKQLRIDTVGIVESLGAQDTFVKMNDSLPPQWKRHKVVKLCDEIMYVIGFAGIGGTCACVESCGAFLQNIIPKEAYAKGIDWGQYDTSAKMIAKYKAEPIKYIKEVCRMDPPVTSATAVLKEVTDLTLNGKEFKMPAGILNQYVVSMANRDTSVFQDPIVFNPDRPNLNKSLTWNGAFTDDASADEALYPRICPGRYLSIDITQAILNHALGFGSGKAGDPKDITAPMGAGCC